MASLVTPQIQFFPTPDGARFALRRFAAQADRRGSVVLLHGIISHSGWYHESASALAQRGFDVYALDRRGSGLNSDRRGDIDEWRTWVRDVIGVCETCHTEGPVVLLGISWGGKLAPVIARERPDLLAGVGMICPGLFAHQQPSLLKRLTLATTGVLNMNQQRVPIPLQPPQLFTESPRWQKYVETDPLTLRRITLRFAREDQRLTSAARQANRWIHAPALLVLAGRDRIVDNRRTRAWFEQIPSDERTLLEYPQAAHTLEFEPDPQPFYDELAHWIEHVTGRQPV